MSRWAIAPVSVGGRRNRTLSRAGSIGDSGIEQTQVRNLIQDLIQAATLRPKLPDLPSAIQHPSGEVCMSRRCGVTILAIDASRCDRSSSHNVTVRTVTT